MTHPWKFELNIIFYSEVMENNVAIKIGQLYMAPKGTFIMFLELYIKRSFQWMIRHGAISISLSTTVMQITQ